MTLTTIADFAGKFHPLLVHLPIGFLILAALFQWVGALKKYNRLRGAVSITLLAGCIAALLSCFTGYFLSLEGGYNITTLDQHMWMGIITTITALIAWLMSIRIIPIPFFNRPVSLNVSLLFILLFITIAGHLGGTLTHGEGFMAFNKTAETSNRPAITNVNEALVYADVIQPILQHKCGDCHNQNKMKGELSLQDMKQIMKGGKHGAVVKPGNPLESEIIKRVSLNPSDKKFMPTDGKPALTAAEKTLISWWIENHLQNEDKNIAAANPPDSVRKMIENYFGGVITADNGVPKEQMTNPPLRLTAPALQANSLQQLTDAGFVVKQIHYAPDLLDVTLPASEETDRKNKLEALKAFKENIVWLNLSGNQLTDDALTEVKQFTNLQRLRLDKNPVTDAGIAELSALKNLESINLCFTKITSKSISTLSSLPGLHTAYVWGSPLPQKDSLIGKDSSLHIIAGEISVR